MVLPVENPTKSYWIEAAESDLRNIRSTPELPTETDVVIIGSGYTGAATAYWIHQFTKNNGTTPKMLMLEARDICGGATGRNGGQLRPHAYSRYLKWSRKFGPDGALKIIKHEMAHLAAFEKLLDAEGITDEVCFKLGKTFDAGMTDERWKYLKQNYDAMLRDHGENGDVIKDCEIIDDPEKAEVFTQMKGCKGAVVHPTGQVWPYKFVHALLRIILKTGCLNIQAHTPVSSISERDGDGFITVKTSRGDVRAKVVMHATNRWASHILPEFEHLIVAGRSTIATIKAPEGFIKHPGAQHWDGEVWNYHLQIPAPYNTIIIGGARKVLVHKPEEYICNDEEDKQFDGVPEYYKKWPSSEVVDWNDNSPAELALGDNEGGCWTGLTAPSLDGFPFVGAVPDHPSQFMAAGFDGHGMPRILLATADLTPQILEQLEVAYTTPELVKEYPSMPDAFRVTAKRIKSLQEEYSEAQYEEDVKDALKSAEKDFCKDARSLRGLP